GSTPNSRRSRPDEPPLSATVTTAVRFPTTRRRAANSADSPCPSPRATPLTPLDRTAGSTGGTSLPPEVTVHRPGVDADTGETRRDLLGHRDAAVLAPGAADGDRHEALALAEVAGGDRLEERDVLLEERLRLRAVLDVRRHLGVPARERTQIGDPVRVGQEAHVGQQVRVDRDAVLEAEAHDGRLERRGVRGA